MPLPAPYHTRSRLEDGRSVAGRRGGRIHRVDGYGLQGIFNDKHFFIMVLNYLQLPSYFKNVSICTGTGPMTPPAVTGCRLPSMCRNHYREDGARDGNSDPWIGANCADSGEREQVTTLTEPPHERP